MKCPKCNGKGDYFNEVFNDGKRRREILVECDMCHGSGEVPMTNEEWFCGLSTEEKAEWFGNWHSFSCVFCKHWKNGCAYNHNQVRCAIEEGKSNKELWLEWLKEIHDDNA